VFAVVVAVDVFSCVDCRMVVIREETGNNWFVRTHPVVALSPHAVAASVGAEAGIENPL
jgi:hypothetical protein